MTSKLYERQQRQCTPTSKSKQFHLMRVNKTGRAAPHVLVQFTSTTQHKITSSGLKQKQPWGQTCHTRLWREPLQPQVCRRHASHQRLNQTHDDHEVHHHINTKPYPTRHQKPKQETGQWKKDNWAVITSFHFIRSDAGRPLP